MTKYAAQVEGRKPLIFETTTENLTGAILGRTPSGSVILVGETTAKSLVQARRDFLRRHRSVEAADVVVVEVRLATDDDEDEPKTSKKAPKVVTSKEENEVATLERVASEDHFCATHGKLSPETISRAYARRKVIRCTKCVNEQSRLAKAAKAAHASVEAIEAAIAAGEAAAAAEIYPGKGFEAAI